MKKKLTIALIVAVIVAAIFAWRVAYSMRKNTDNLPTLTAIAEMSEAEVNSFLPGYKINQLTTVWGEPDASGRRSPVAIPGATETIETDLVIVAVGVSPNPIVPRSISGLDLGRKNTIVVNEEMESSIPMIYAGGDIVRGGATVILAMGDGKKAAEAMAEKLK